MKVAKPNIALADLLPFIGKQVVILEFNPANPEPSGCVGTLLFAAYVDDDLEELVVRMASIDMENDDDDLVTFDRSRVVHVMDLDGLNE